MCLKDLIELTSQNHFKKMEKNEFSAKMDKLERKIEELTHLVAEL